MTSVKLINHSSSTADWNCFLSFITFVICKYLNEPNISTRNFNFPLNKKVC